MRNPAKLELTADGSHTVLSSDGGWAYHSKHGAIQESAHVYIRSAFDLVIAEARGKPVSIFEMGFGTGLNALLTFISAAETQTPVLYTSIETDPLTGSESRLLNYTEVLQRTDLQPVFNEMHDATWETKAVISPLFTIRKLNVGLSDFHSDELFDLVYFDAFAPDAQPELWTEEVFMKMFSILKPGGMLVTYCSKGEVKRAMRNSGFIVKRVRGPLYKRHIVRATKPV